MVDHLSFIDGLLLRIDGPMSFRLLLQPVMAIIFACRDGIADARADRPPYFWALFSDQAPRREMLRSGWKSIGKVFLLAVILDFVFQYLAFHEFRVLGALVVGLTLAVLPYLLLRGPVRRLLQYKR
jgi:hypothetical protein